MNSLWIAGLGLIVWVAMLGFCMPHDAHFIQHDLTSRSQLLLANRNIPSNGLTVDGRDVTLTGFAGTPQVSDRAVKMVEAVWGVRTVRTNILPQPPVTKEQAHAAAASISDILKLQNVEFFSASDRLTPSGQQTLNQVADVLSKYPGMPVEIGGHTDSSGDPESNLTLSRMRAAAVKRYLVGRGIAEGTLTDVGFGQAQPIASNETAEGRQQNRRVEFHTKETK